MGDEFTEFVAKLTDNARTSLHHANIIAQGYGSPYIGTEHILMGILASGSSVGAKVLADSGVTLDRAQTALKLAPLTTVIVGTELKRLSETAKLTLKMSWDIAQEYHQEYLGTEHILYSLLSQKNSRASVLLRDMGVSLPEISADVIEFLDQNNGSFQHDDLAASPAYLDKKRPKQKGALGVFGVDLTALAKAGKLDPVIGRDQQEERVVTILSRRTKNNPVLIG
jgi:ATP-dependent Clp protease ATP-binding subunit ClpC